MGGKVFPYIRCYLLRQTTKTKKKTFGSVKFEEANKESLCLSGDSGRRVKGYSGRSDLVLWIDMKQAFQDITGQLQVRPMLYTLVCGMWYVVCGMWYVVCGMWYVVCIPQATYHIPHTTYHIPHTTYHIPHTTYHIPRCIAQAELGVGP